ncbi:hypothetical protein F5Y10DRAFT_231358 [Nemania abortiva]|nr:hypothetical protein F5Y10DRAFT_231358 [Nemania abortiva]
MTKAIDPSLSAGKALAAVNSRAIRNIEPSISSLAAKGPTVVHIYDFVRTTIMAATTESVFGPRNPMRAATIVDAWM